ncbi:MAG: hypothetical protein QN172_06385 [Armatimonadota bacterium]|nr:hypothetical protein [Armatimonadota bacterium]MDR7439615.1 hypothetical protein [Armatimonadota bacterium]MDR7562826.1 hypothetical protein [Armatimonadota bacterium]MDR7568310.1 hypothetical protein [Armatimonadota bacterium]MDR7602072.1 hypothetical protein [Armatimonadota bacterium]
MKLVVVIYEAGIDDSMMDLLHRLELPGWTKMEGAMGFGRKGLRLGSAIWPGTNNLLFLVLEEPQVRILLEALEALKREYLRPPALFAFVQSVEGIW